MKNENRNFCTYLFHVFLKQPQSQSLVQFDFLGVPLFLERPVVIQNLMDDRQNVTGTFTVISSRITAGPRFEISSSVALNKNTISEETNMFWKDKAIINKPVDKIQINNVSTKIGCLMLYFFWGLWKKSRV